MRYIVSSFFSIHFCVLIFAFRPGAAWAAFGGSISPGIDRATLCEVFGGKRGVPSSSLTARGCGANACR